ncbi:hypothetical protein E4U17_001461, partial [Claviceps sp. LM77 group G4]
MSRQHLSRPPMPIAISQLPTTLPRPMPPPTTPQPVHHTLHNLATHQQAIRHQVPQGYPPQHQALQHKALRQQALQRYPPQHQALLHQLIRYKALQRIKTTSTVKIWPSNSKPMIGSV